MSKRYQYEIIREEISTETLHAIIVAKTAAEAKEIAEDIGNGVSPDWPTIDRYNVASRDPDNYNLISVKEIKSDAST